MHGRVCSILVLSLILLPESCRPGSGLIKADRHPNIVVLIADDLGWADVGYHGSRIQTPHIDRLASEGIRLEQHYVAPTCTPTRVALVTGRYASRYGVVAPAYGEIFDEDTITLPQALRKAGYETFIVGKWHMGSPPDYTPLRYGFDHSYGYFHGQIDPYTHRYKTGERSWHRDDRLLDETGHATDLITEEAVRIIETERTKPFFLHIAYSVPHFPLQEPSDWTSRYDDVEPISRRWYAASVTHMDHGIGRILESVDKQSLTRKTLVLFMSDNGGEESWSDERIQAQYGGQYSEKPHNVLGDNSPLRGWKYDAYEGGIRVPAVIYSPGVLKPGTLSEPIHVVDWMPTLCRLAGYQDDMERDGIDVWGLVTGEDHPVRSQPLYWKTADRAAVRDGDWKLIRSLDGQVVELFNLSMDPFEENDLAGEEPDRVERLQKALDAIAALDRER